MAISDHRAGQARGFTLLETLIALVIAAVALVALAHSAGSGLELAQSATRLDQAVSRARSHLAAAGLGRLTGGRQGGDDGGGYRWQSVTLPVAAGPITLLPPPATARPAPARLLALFDITTTVYWQEGGRERSVSLSSQAFGPSDVPPP